MYYMVRSRLFPSGAILVVTLITAGLPPVAMRAQDSTNRAAIVAPDSEPSERATSARVWNARTDGDVLEIEGNGKGMLTAAFCKGGERVVLGETGGAACVCDARTGAKLLSLGRTGYNGCFASVSADGKRILTTGIPYVKLWDGETGRELLDLTPEVGLARSWPFPSYATISSDGTKIVTNSPAVTVLANSIFPLAVRDAKTGEELATLKGQGYWSNRSVFSPDGSRLATGCQTSDDAARVWDCKTGAELFSFHGHGGAVWAVGFSHDGRRLVTGGANRHVKVWDLQTGEELLTLVGHTRVVTAVAFSPDGKWIVTGSQDHTSRLWDATNGTELVVMKGHGGIVTDVNFSPDGKYAVTACWSKFARVWNLARHLAPQPAPEAK